ncbi:hypothetical protein QTP70_007251 [Hemibagrus guttatus]|uniref:Uncharacterized protein n=1 Tax=Hemibagrus guttatus TaxID=175788 RepID=A0AAE0UT28_9TELE|nr:hypothetical protein QTP70_007251 [Hemibagrus guttatus]
MKKRCLDVAKLRKMKKLRLTEKISESAYSFLKFMTVWIVVLLADFILEFRLEYLWPCWLFLGTVYTTFHCHGLAICMVFVCAAFTLDIFCLIFVPLHWLFFAASTYVLLNYIWHTEKGICLSTVTLWILLVYTETSLRLRDLKNPYANLSHLFAAHWTSQVPSGLDLQHALGRFAAKCEAAGMRVSTSKSEAMVLDRKKVACTLQVGGKVLPQVEEFKYLGVLFTSEGRMDHEIDRRIGAAAAVMRSMYRSVVVKKELSRKAKPSIYQSIYAPTLTYGHELWVMTERVRSRIQAAEMSFLRRVAGHSLRDRVRSSVTREELGVEPLLLHIEMGQLRWLGHLFRMPPGRLPGEVFRACPTGKRRRGRPRTRWRDYVFRLAWERLGVPPEELEEVARERDVWASLLRLLPPRPGSG